MMKNSREAIEESPEISKKHCKPIAVVLHGGAWVIGQHDQESSRDLGKNLSRMGYFVVSVNYRLCTINSSTIQTIWLVVSGFSLVAAFFSDNIIEKIGFLGLYAYSMFQLFKMQRAQEQRVPYYPRNHYTNSTKLKIKKMASTLPSLVTKLKETQTQASKTKKKNKSSSAETGTSNSGNGQNVTNNPTQNSEIRYPIPANDIVSSLVWLQNHGRKMGGDPSRMIIIGHSAGAHLGASVIADESFLRNADFPVENIKGFVGISGVYSAKLIKEWGVMRFVGQYIFGNDMELWPNYMPADQVLHHTRPNILPPHLLLTAELDPGLHAQSLHYRQSLEERNIPVQVQNIRNTTHFNIVLDHTESNFGILTRIENFMFRCLDC